MEGLKGLVAAVAAAFTLAAGAASAQNQDIKLYVFTSGSLGGFPKAALQIGGQGNIDWAPVSFYVIKHPQDFLRAYPELALDIARRLAERLHSMTTYLVDLKKQYEGSEDHFGMVDEVLETLSHAQRSSHVPGSNRDPDPDVT